MAAHKAKCRLLTGLETIATRSVKPTSMTAGPLAQYLVHTGLPAGARCLEFLKHFLVGIEEAVHDALTGHTGNSVSRKYGNEQYPLEPLFEARERYDIADLDLAHLYKRPVAKPLLASNIKLVSAYYGVTIAFTAARAKRETAPFIVALCDGAEAGFDVASNKVTFGQLPANKQLLLTMRMSRTLLLSLRSTSSGVSSAVMTGSG